MRKNLDTTVALVIAKSAPVGTPMRGHPSLRSLAPPLPMKTHCVFMGASYGFPVLKIGSRMVVPKEQFICWVEEHTGGGT